MAKSQLSSTFCECGCGQLTNISTCTDAYGVKGEPRRYIFGHRRPRPTTHGYIETSTGKIHRQRAERALGHPLPPKAVVHHPDRDPSNPNARLVILENQAFHRRMRVKEAGGNPNTEQICTGCHQVKAFTEFTINRATPTGYDRYCRVCKPPRLMATYRKYRDVINARRRARRLAQQRPLVDTDEQDSDT